ncbi:MAG TPA: tripartite tricarboxylate transporter substrate binding protein [Burkholderiales bacterium]|nr:tripartite tricarboxylate transporter substrate binding protein [Burkholderiales bacterium]
MIRTLVAVAAALFVGTAGAQQYPTKPVRFVVPYAAGGATDLIARTIGEKLSASLGQPVVVDNRPGAATLVGAQFVAKAEPDGHTLLMATSTTLAINASLYSKLPYDPVKDFAPISLVIQHPFVLLVNPAVPANSVKELVALAKSKPGQLAYASGGSGSFPHLAMAMFQSMTGIDVIHVPYKGSAPALTDLMGGQIAMMFDNTALNYVKGGKIRALAVTTKQRLSVMPDVPTLAEAGVPGYELAAWQGVIAPAGTPRPVVDRLNGEIVKLLQLPDVQARLTADGGQIITSTPDQFAAHIKTEIGRFAKVVKDSGAKVE